MRILVVSDTHGYLGGLQTVLEKEKNLDLLIHCGDVEGQAAEVYKMAGIPCYFVAGNNDWSPDLSKELLLQIEGHTIFVCHGHRYCVSIEPSLIRDRAKERGADICLFGHTHIPKLDTFDGITYLNPGSLTYPRQKGRKQTYGLLEIFDDHTIKPWIREI